MEYESSNRTIVIGVILFVFLFAGVGSYYALKPDKHKEDETEKNEVLKSKNRPDADRTFSKKDVAIKKEEAIEKAKIFSDLTNAEEKVYLKTCHFNPIINEYLFSIENISDDAAGQIESRLCYNIILRQDNINSQTLIDSISGNIASSKENTENATEAENFLTDTPNEQDSLKFISEDLDNDGYEEIISVQMIEKGENKDIYLVYYSFVPNADSWLTEYELINTTPQEMEINPDKDIVVETIEDLTGDEIKEVIAEVTTNNIDDFIIKSPNYLWRSILLDEQGSIESWQIRNNHLFLTENIWKENDEPNSPSDSLLKDYYYNGKILELAN